MTGGEQIFNGYVWTHNAELIGVAIHRYIDEGQPVFDVYYGGGTSDDELYTAKRFVERFGRELYTDVADFKKGNSIGAERVLV